MCEIDLMEIAYQPTNLERKYHEREREQLEGWEKWGDKKWWEDRKVGRQKIF